MEKKVSTIKRIFFDIKVKVFIIKTMTYLKFQINSHDIYIKIVLSKLNIKILFLTILLKFKSIIIKLF